MCNSRYCVDGRSSNFLVNLGWSLLFRCFFFFFSLFFFFNETATTEFYTLSLHDALPIQARKRVSMCKPWSYFDFAFEENIFSGLWKLRWIIIYWLIPLHLPKRWYLAQKPQKPSRLCARISRIFGIGRAHVWTPVTATSRMPSSAWRTKLNSSHGYISYAVFCLKKKNLSKIP